MANMTDAPVSRPWRRYLRFSVRGMVIIVLLIGGRFGWIVEWHVNFSYHVRAN
jgi:hypothetical protein